MLHRACLRAALQYKWQGVVWARVGHSWRRHLSASQASIALRPFYVAVHPDLFGLFPQARDKNEESLKQLHQYLDCVQTANAVKPVTLLFFVKPQSPVLEDESEDLPNSPPIRLSTVRISLTASTLRDAVTLVLKSCNLPLDYVNSIPVPSSLVYGQRYSLKDVGFDEGFARWGMPNPENVPPKPVNTLSVWLRRNIDKARAARSAIGAIQADIERIRARLQAEAGVTEFVWASSWGTAQFRACLKTLENIHDQYASELQLEGYGVTFCGTTGVSSRSHVLLSYDEVPQIWLQVLTTASQHAPVLKKLRGYENQLSHLLRSANIVRAREPVVLANSYLEQLQTLIKALEGHLIDSSNCGLYYNLSDVDLILVSAVGPIELNSRGQVVVPSFCPAYHLVDFLNDNVPRARNLKTTFLQNERTIQELVSQCKEILCLAEVEWDPSITDAQLIHCLKKLKNPRNVGLSLRDCELKITRFYSVMSGGKICIPWNWKGAYDEE